MLHQQPGAVAQPQSKLILQQARTQSEIAEAQALRYRVFIEEMGASIASKVEGIDRDMFDPYCDHLIVRDSASFDVVGTYRILPPAQAHRIGGFYADEEFDLTRLANLRHELVELGRSCVHPDYRNGATIALLWNGIAQYLQANNYRYLIGCASVSLSDGGAGAAAVYHQVREKHLGPIEWRVFPRCPLPAEMVDTDPGGQGSERRSLPPLIKGYLRAGAHVCGDPAWDADFNTADLFMLLPIAHLNQRHAARFMGG